MFNISAKIKTWKNDIKFLPWQNQIKVNFKKSNEILQTGAWLSNFLLKKQWNFAILTNNQKNVSLDW